MTFDQWMKQIDDPAWQRAGCSVHDLPDCLFRDWYEDGLTPDEAAQWVIEEA